MIAFCLQIHGEGRDLFPAALLKRQFLARHLYIQGAFQYCGLHAFDVTNAGSAFVNSFFKPDGT